jgi:hypothetical protein
MFSTWCSLFVWVIYRILERQIIVVVLDAVVRRVCRAFQDTALSHEQQSREALCGKESSYVAQSTVLFCMQW